MSPKLREVFRFEIAQQSRRATTWLYFAVLLVLVFRFAREAYVPAARSDGFFFNAPFVVAAVTVLGSAMGLLAAAALAGQAAARDAQARMDPLLYTAPVGRAAYLGGRFLAAFALQALVLLALPAALLLAAYLPGVEPELLGPFRPAAYLGAYLLFALPNAFVATALAFALAALGRRAIAGYLGGVLVFLASLLSLQLVAGRLGRWELAKLLDPLGLTLMRELTRAWTPLEKSSRLPGLEGSLLANRLLWLGIALGVLALTLVRFRFAHHAGADRRAASGRDARPSAPRIAADAGAARKAVVAAARTRRTSGFATRVRQTWAIALQSFRAVVASRGALALVAVAAILVLFAPIGHLGVPLVPTTAHLITFLLSSQDLLGMIIPLLTALYAGELVWREREARLGEMADAAPVPEWVPFAGKLLGLALAIVAAQALMMAAGMLVQVRRGYFHFEPGLYARTLFGLQLAGYLLFAVLALAVHVGVDQKWAGHLVVLLALGFTAFAPALGIDNGLLVYGSDPGWTYSDMRGFGPYLAPVVWLKLYWAAWAMLIGLAARLLWVRGTERAFGARLRQARARATRPVAVAAVVAAGLVLALGGFVFYNTNVLNDPHPAATGVERRAAYERRYGRFEGVPQPQLAATQLRVEIHPRRGTAEIRGSYVLVNRTGRAIDSVHLAPAWGVETGAVSLDRPAARVLADDDLGHWIYALAAPLEPGDSLRLGFAVRYAPRGFPADGPDPSVSANGTCFVAAEWLPAIGYQPGRELRDGGARRTHGLPPRSAVPSLNDERARRDMAGAERIRFEAVVGTDTDQVAVAPGTLRRTWTAGGRRWFQYAADAPIRNDYAFFSARYALREARWNGVAIQVFHHPGHAWNVDRMLRSVQASLAHLTREYGPYPYRQIRLVEHPGAGPDLHGYPINISYQEGFSIMDPDRDPRRIDFPFAVVAHEVSHQWWGNQVEPAFVQGGALLSESLAWYSALAVVEESYGPEHLRRLLAMMREEYLAPRARAGVPLLRASDRFVAYRKGPFAMYALREYVGQQRVNAALRRFFEQHRAGTPPLPTSLDLYRELQAATPDSLRYLLADLFEANTFWQLQARRATAERTAGGAWRVTLDVRARKVVVDSAGAETEVPMNDLVQVGVFSAAPDGEPGEPLYLAMHRVRSGEQRIVVTVPREPARAGIDPRNLLIDVEPGDNLREIAHQGSP